MPATIRLLASLLRPTAAPKKVAGVSDPGYN